MRNESYARFEGVLVETFSSCGGTSEFIGCYEIFVRHRRDTSVTMFAHFVTISRYIFIIIGKMAHIAWYRLQDGRLARSMRDK